MPHVSAGSALLVGTAALVASTLAAITGFGGAAVLLPVLVVAFGVRDAVPILTVAQLIGNGSRVWFNRRELNYRVVGWFALGSVPLGFLGGLLFARAPLPALTRLLGAFLLLVVAWRRLRPRGFPRPPLRGFALIGAAASFVSALLGSVGPADGAVLSRVWTREGRLHRHRGAVDGRDASDEACRVPACGGAFRQPFSLGPRWVPSWCWGHGSASASSIDCPSGCSWC